MKIITTHFPQQRRFKRNHQIKTQNIHSKKTKNKYTYVDYTNVLAELESTATEKKRTKIYSCSTCECRLQCFLVILSTLLDK